MNASQDFFATLATMCHGQESGALFAITDHDRMLVIALTDGQITGMRFGRLSGKDVIAELQTIELKSFSIKPDKSIPAQADLPSTSEILNALSSRIPADLLADALAVVFEKGRPVASSKPPKMMYRGQAVMSEEPSTPQVAQARQLTYRGQVVAAESAPEHPAPQKRVMMYRGQVVGDTPPPTAEKPPKESVKMYRGQLIA